MSDKELHSNDDADDPDREHDLDSRKEKFIQEVRIILNISDQ
jgi:hypothetical protein